MSPLLFLALGAFCIYTLIKNVKLAKATKASRGFVSSYQTLIKEQDDGYNKTIDFLEKETNPIYITGINIIKAIYEIKEDKDYSDSLNNIDLKIAFYSNEKFNNELFVKNTDFFLWLTLLLVASKNKGKEDVKDAIFHQLNDLNDVKETVEYHFLEACSDRLFGKEETFLNDLIEGNYPNMPHSKNYIGFLKRTSETILDAQGVELDQFYLDDLKDFATFAYGKYLMKELGNFEKFETKDDNTEALENISEEVVEIEENKEEK